MDVAVNFVEFPVVEEIILGCLQPDDAGRIFGNSVDAVVISTQLDGGISFALITVVAVQAVEGGKPHKSILVTQDGLYVIVRYPRFHIKCAET